MGFSVIGYFSTLGPRNLRGHFEDVNFYQANEITLQSLSLFLFFLRQKANMAASKHMRQLTIWQIYVQQRGYFTAWNRTANLFLEIWESLTHYLVV